MRPRFSFFPIAVTAMVCALIAPASFGQDADLDQIVERFKKSMANTKSWTADMSMKMSVQGMTMNWTGDVTNNGEQSATKMSMEMMGQKMSMLSVVDADGVSWTEMNMGGMVQVMKMDVEALKAAQDSSAGIAGLSSPGGVGGGADSVKLIQEMLNTYDLTLDGTDTLEGTEVYRITAAMKDELKSGLDPTGMMEQAGLSLDKMRLAFGVEDGFVRQYEMMSADGTPFMTMTFSNVNLDPTIDDALFQYTPPEGAIVQDMAEVMAAGLGGADASGGKLALGSPAPEFTGTNLAGDAVSLSDYKGKVVLVDFWATWNGQYVRELPNIIEAYNSYHDKGFEIIAISLDDSRGDLNAFLSDHPDMTWVQLFDGKGWDSEIAVQYEVEGIPFTLLLDREGNIVRQDLRGEALGNALADLLGG